VVFADTDGAVIETDADVEPAGTVTLAGRPEMAGDALSVTTAPPLGAAPVKYTVAESDPPLATDARLTVREERVTAGGGAEAGVTVTG